MTSMTPMTPNWTPQGHWWTPTETPPETEAPDLAALFAAAEETDE